uniref:DUF155 domain-containing protein n=1 Tax=Romanomermis culicivorax TaxID=13658 RepID=A0A915JAN2_ROMCU
MAHVKTAKLFTLNFRCAVRTHFCVKSVISSRFLSRDRCKFYATVAHANQQQAENVKNVKIPTKFTTDEKTPLSNISQKRPQRKLRIEHVPNIYAYSTAEEYDFDSLRAYFLNAKTASKFSLRPVTFELGDKILRLVCRTDVTGQNTLSYCNCLEIKNATNNAESVALLTQDPRLAISEILIFTDGAIVMWNVAEKDRLEFLDNVLPNDEVDDAHFKVDEILRLRSPMTFDDEENFLNRYAISDAMSRSVKVDLKLYIKGRCSQHNIKKGSVESLAIRENALSNFVDTLNPIVEDLKRGRIRVRKGDLLKKTGHLFALRHNISLDSDLLDSMPDFYWDRDQLEKLYSQASRIFCIENRTKVINEKLTYCLQLGERLDGHLNATHSVRLERIIIFLIAIEVAFEFWPYGADYYRSIM